MQSNIESPVVIDFRFDENALPRFHMSLDAESYQKTLTCLLCALALLMPYIARRQRATIGAA